jgi:hypothetical protein
MRPLEIVVGVFDAHVVGGRIVAAIARHALTLCAEIVGDGLIFARGTDRRAGLVVHALNETFAQIVALVASNERSD